MNTILERLQQIEASVSAERGPFCLFALFLPEDAPGKWDLVVAAPWIEEDSAAGVRVLADVMQRTFARDEIVVFGGIAVASCEAEEIDWLDNIHRVEHGMKELHNQTFFGNRIETAYLITAMRHETDHIDG